MAVRARLTPPRETKTDWPWHKVKSSSLRASLLFGGGRRMEAETFLKSGFAIRNSIEAKANGWVRFGDLALVSAPPRIKQILVSPENGVPYLNTSQVFDPMPSPRKWLAVEKTTAAQARFVDQGTILVMASATVGRAIVATRQHEKSIISHHFLRVEPREKTNWGWLYAFIRSPQCQAMIGSSQYASVIRHIESSHLNALPIPIISEDLAMHFNAEVKRIIELRNEATALTMAAEDLFEKSISLSAVRSSVPFGSVSIGSFRGGRRRLEAAYHAPEVQEIISRFHHWEPLSALVDRVWWPNRFKRIVAEEGTPYLGPDELFTTNVYATTKVQVVGKTNSADFEIKENWIVMARSGQTYGLNGSAKLVTKYHLDWLLSDDLIRIATRPNTARPGYVLTALTHPTLGRPLVIREAYGTSIPHLDPSDVSNIRIIRLGAEREAEIGELAENAALRLAEAEAAERDLAAQAEAVVDDFVSGSSHVAVAG
ncbi:hypothetical protein ACC697_29360 [Rhizobium ruizarguesonis]